MKVFIAHIQAYNIPVPVFSHQVEWMNLKEASTHVSGEDIGKLKQLQCCHPLTRHAHPLPK